MIDTALRFGPAYRRNGNAATLLPLSKMARSKATSRRALNVERNVLNNLFEAKARVIAFRVFL